MGALRATGAAWQKSLDMSPEEVWAMRGLGSHETTCSRRQAYYQRISRRECFPPGYKLRYRAHKLRSTIRFSTACRGDTC